MFFIGLVILGQPHDNDTRLSSDTQITNHKIAINNIYSTTTSKVFIFVYDAIGEWCGGWVEMRERLCNKCWGLRGKGAAVWQRLYGAIGV